MSTRRVAILPRRKTLAFDPGVNTGWALFSAQGYLEKAGLLLFREGLPEPMTAFPPLREVKITIIEKPRIYDRKRWKGDPNDLLAVALIGGFCGGLAYCNMNNIADEGSKIRYVYPQTWKGGRPKEADNKYTMLQLDDNEQKILKRLGLAKNKFHNVIDAVGIGLWAVKRR